MGKEYSSDNGMEVVEDMTQQIVKILESEDITYGMAKTIIQRVEADLLEDGNAFLNKSALKNVLPFRS